MCRKQPFDVAKNKIKKRISDYSRAIGALTNTITNELLRFKKAEKRIKILNWLWPGDYRQTHDQLQRGRTSDTGKWVFQRTEVGQWLEGKGPRLLLCYGMRMYIL